MRISTLALAGAFMVVATAALADDPMSNTYANTVTTKGAIGSGKLLFNADGTYDASTTTPDGKPFAYKGTWATKDGGATICLTPQLPPNAPGAGTSCSPLMKHAVGETWSVTNDKGETFEVSLVAGR